MTVPLNPAAVDAELMRLSDLLEERVEDFTRASRAAAEAESTYKRRFAESMLDVINSNGPTRTTVQEREARVDIATADEYAAKLITDATARSVRESINSIRVQIEALRTIAASMRAAIDMTR